MPFALIAIGLLLLVAGVRNTQTNLFDLVKGDFTGKNNFVYWVLAITVLGALGYVESIRPLSRAFLVLVIIVLVIHNGGFFTKFHEQITAPLPAETEQTK